MWHSPSFGLFFLEVAVKRKLIRQMHRRIERSAKARIQRRVRRPPTIDGMDVDEFIMQNADPIWLHQNELWEYMDKTDES